ncbi:unnamed protein product [Fusarium graminearum]|uniref:LITAF domain-containing protein n=1 Tax=Gibberella zeae TaxID=5518 RepID=A0A679NMV4_GIBZA|nr:unnamed protein product [Fusarium graminearum]CAF3612589.1 unnamed protein product [Fusarium graminearum]CAG1964304.1 unnamed protein product [Fusarium graminearum]CAG1966044.1 unnamed protein product [Fusarium graminearum]CAG1986073.1 unnamed protein product [Fusarium graminearum]
MTNNFKTMTTTLKLNTRSPFHDDQTIENNRIELYTLDANPKENEITAFNTISPTNIVPLRKLKQWPRGVLCPACREISITRVERKICGGTHAMAALMFACTIVGGPLAYVGKQWKNAEHYCCRCDRRLVTWHFSSGTEIHVW